MIGADENEEGSNGVCGLIHLTACNIGKAESQGDGLTIDVAMSPRDQPELDSLLAKAERLLKEAFDLGRTYERGEMAKALGLSVSASPKIATRPSRTKSGRKFGEISSLVRDVFRKYSPNEVGISLPRLFENVRSERDGKDLTDRQLRAAVKLLVKNKELVSTSRGHYKATAKLADQSSIFAVYRAAAE